MKIIGIIFLLIGGFILIFQDMDMSKKIDKKKNKGPFKEEIVLLSGDNLVNGIIEKKINEANDKKIVSRINYKNGIPVGNFDLFTEEGKLLATAEGEWENKIFQGTIRQYFPDTGKVHRKVVGDFVINTGELIKYEGLEAEKVLYDNIVSADYMEYTADEKLAVETKIKEKKYDGKYKEFYSNGNLSKETNYVQGKLDGKYIYYSEDGKIKESSIYRNGELQDTISYDEDGEPIYKKYLPDEYKDVIENISKIKF